MIMIAAPIVKTRVNFAQVTGLSLDLTLIDTDHEPDEPGSQADASAPSKGGFSQFYPPTYSISRSGSIKE